MISFIAKVEGEWEINEGVQTKVAHRRAVSKEGNADRWVPTRRLLWMYPLSLLPTDVEGAVLLASTVDIFMGMVPIKGSLEVRSFGVDVRFPKAAGKVCHVCRNQRPGCDVKIGTASTKCTLFKPGFNRCNRCFNFFTGSIQHHFTEHYMEEKLYLQAGYVQPTALVATSNSDSVIDEPAETKVARIMAQQMKAAPVMRDQDAESAQSRAQTTTSNGADLKNFKARFAKRDRTRGGTSTPAKPPTQRQNIINPIATPRARSPAHSI